MAAILSVTYTPNYSGCHRICFKSTQPDYCVYTDNSPSAVGVEKTTTIDLTDYEECLVDYPIPIGCNGATLDGYVQPCCTDPTSLDNRVSFSALFEQTPCTSYNIECEASGIAEITINNPGYGWPLGVVPAVTITDSSGFGTGFAADLTMNCLPGDSFCSIDDITITNNGQNYYDLNDLTVNVLPAPTCIGSQLVINGSFNDGSNGWTVSPTGLVPDAWGFTIPQADYDMQLYSSTQPGKLSQNILTPGKTYIISFKMTIGVDTGNGYVVVSAGTFDPSGTQPNQYLHTQLPGPDFIGFVTTTLTCTGTSEFSIYIYSDVPQLTVPLFTVDNVSVIEICNAITPDLEVTSLTNCGTFTVPQCDGTSDPTTYELLAGPQYAINVCAGGSGPDAPAYTIIPNPVGISCCDCKSYNIVVRNPIDVYYTSCNQTIDIVSVEAGALGATVCAVTDSVWPVNPAENEEILAITEVGDCTPG